MHLAINVHPVQDVVYVFFAGYLMVYDWDIRALAGVPARMT